MGEVIREIQTNKAMIKTYPKSIPIEKLDVTNAYTFNLGESTHTFIPVREIFGPEGNLKKLLNEKLVMASSICMFPTGQEEESIIESEPISRNKIKLIVKRSESGRPTLIGTARIVDDKLIFQMNRVRRSTSKTVPFKLTGEIDQKGRWKFNASWKK